MLGNISAQTAWAHKTMYYRRRSKYVSLNLFFSNDAQIENWSQKFSVYDTRLECDATLEREDRTANVETI